MGFGGGSDLEWPELDDLKRRLDITADPSEHDGELEVILAAAIAQIKLQVGNWDEMVDTPNEQLAEAALDRAVELGADVLPPRNERKSEQLLMGQRRRFGIG